MPGPGVEGQKRARRLGAGLARIDPGQIADTAEVEESHRRLQLHPAGQGEMIERRQRRALPAQLHIGAAKIPHHRQDQNRSHHRAVARRMGAAPARIMRQGRAVKAHQFRLIGVMRQKLGMRSLDHLGRLLHASLARPAPEARAQHHTLGLGIGAVTGVTEGIDPLAIGFQQRRVHPVKRRARHRPQCPDRPAQRHCPRPISLPFPQAATPI